MKAEFQRENEDTLESIRQTSRELKLHLMTINHFIPKEYQVIKGAKGSETISLYGEMSHIPLYPGSP